MEAALLETPLVFLTRCGEAFSVTEEGSAWYARAFIIKLKCEINLRPERQEVFQHLLVRHQTQWVDLRHEDAGGDHVELDVDQEGTENIPDQGGSTESSLLMGYYICN